MAQEIINIGAVPDDGQGDPLRTAFNKCNENFTALFSGAGAGGNTWATLGQKVDEFGPVNISLGQYAANVDQGYGAVAFGANAGNTAQGNVTVAVGLNAGANAQTEGAIAVGLNAGQDTQGYAAVAIGWQAAMFQQSDLAIAIGWQAGGTETSQGYGAIAIGTNNDGVGNNSITLGHEAGSGVDNSILLNATGTPIYASGAGLFVTPIREDAVYTSNVMAYNFATNELTYANTVSLSGNITGNYFFGNGAFLTGISSGSGGGANIANGTSNVKVVSSGGNVTTSIGGTSNVIVIASTGQYVTGLITATGLISAVGNVSGGNIRTFGIMSALGNVTGGNVTTAGVVSATGNIASGNVTTAGLISATGNITGNFFVGNGSQLTGIITSVSNISNGTSNINAVSSGGNITVGIGGTSNVAVFAATGQYVNGIISATGNVIANNFVGGGAGSPAVSSSTTLNLSSPITVQVLGGGTFRLPSLTTADIGNLTPANGDIIYNSSLNKFQGFENGAWGNLI